jgi:putative ABC transport system ATP-binding protein
MMVLTQVTKVFNQGKANEFTALHAINLEIEAGKITVLQGPSGSGKTTALSIIGAMVKPTAGRVHVFGREITSLPERFLASIRRTHFGFVFQHFNLIKGITALENIMLPAYPDGARRPVLQERALQLLETFGLSHKAGSKTEWLSGGEAQRVTIARALINNPKVVIADEPTAHLDTTLSQEFMQIVRRLKQEGRTILIASHDPLIFEGGHVDRIIGFRDGRIVESQTPA